MSDSEKPETQRHPAALSSEYHKAHKQLMLWSTILLIWELIGVDLSKAKDAGGNIGPIVTALKSPQAVPWALTGLVVYFLFKCSVEWAQCHPGRRQIRFARIDFISALVVAVAAITLYIGQAISRVQFADALQGSDRLNSFLNGSLLGFGIDWLFILFVARRRLGRWSRLLPGLVAFVFLSFGIFETIRQRHILGWRVLLIGMGVTALLILPIWKVFTSGDPWDRLPKK